MADRPEPDAGAVHTSVERRIVSVLFADLLGFTPRSEWLDAEDVATIQDAYFGGVTGDTVNTAARLGKAIRCAPARPASSGRSPPATTMRSERCGRGWRSSARWSSWARGSASSPASSRCASGSTAGRWSTRPTVPTPAA